MTKQKALILNIVHAAKCHYTAEEIFEQARCYLPGISRATVYNNLHALEKEKYILKITAEGSSDVYDSSSIPHGHLFCTVCHKIKDFSFPALYEKLEDIAGSDIDSYELKVRYVCPECRRIF